MRGNGKQAGSFRCQLQQRSGHVQTHRDHSADLEPVLAQLLGDAVEIVLRFPADGLGDLLVVPGRKRQRRIGDDRQRLDHLHQGEGHAKEAGKLDCGRQRRFGQA